MRRIVVVSIALAMSLAGYASAQPSAKKFAQTTGPVADQAKTEIMQLEKDKALVFPQGNAAMADFFDRGQADDVFIVNPNGTLSTKADHLATWHTGAMTQQSESPSDYLINIYENGHLAVVTYMDTIHLTRDGKKLVHVSRIWNAYVKQDGKWIVVLHGVSRKGA